MGRPALTKLVSQRALRGRRYTRAAPNKKAAVLLMPELVVLVPARASGRPVHLDSPPLPTRPRPRAKKGQKRKRGGGRGRIRDAPAEFPSAQVFRSCSFRPVSSNKLAVVELEERSGRERGERV